MKRPNWTIAAFAAAVLAAGGASPVRRCRASRPHRIHMCRVA